MKHFVKVITARLDPTTEATGVLWSVMRGYNHNRNPRPHLACACTGFVDSKHATVKMIHVRELLECDPQAFSFSDFCTYLRVERDVHTVALANDDPATKDILRRNKISPCYVQGTLDEYDPDAKTGVKWLVPPGVNKSVLHKHKWLVHSAALSAVEDQDGVLYV